MRPGQISKRSRGRSRKPNVQINRTFDSNGPDVKIRGSAAQIVEKYQALARDAQSAGDHIQSENYLQHAEHYLRVLNAMQQTMQTFQGQRPNGTGERWQGEGANGNGHGNGAERDGEDRGEASDEGSQDGPSPSGEIASAG
ncbi:MAG: DUF4167 domain-containing protein [Alphaproteobacteria bacterium]|nr:DUF4167 domain-containing protein [Alphaproteobacteria bacterium]